MRAILLAAGLGTRLQPLTFTTPKSLIKVNGEPMIEKQIAYLREIGVDDIYIVTGYLKEKFEYLTEKYGVTLIYNDKYDQYNNIYTMYLVRKFLPDAYVIDADVFLKNNFLIPHPKTSTYFSARKPTFQGEWMIRFDEDHKIYDIEIGDGENDYILSGVSYWSEADGNFIIKKIEAALEEGNFQNLYWDNIVKDNMNSLHVYVHEIHPDDSHEIDSLEDLNKLNQLLEMERNITALEEEVFAELVFL